MRLNELNVPPATQVQVQMLPHKLQLRHRLHLLNDLAVIPLQHLLAQFREEDLEEYMRFFNSHFKERQVLAYLIFKHKDHSLLRNLYDSHHLNLIPATLLAQDLFQLIQVDIRQVNGAQTSL